MVLVKDLNIYQRDQLDRFGHREIDTGNAVVHMKQRMLSFRGLIATIKMKSHGLFVTVIQLVCSISNRIICEKDLFTTDEAKILYHTTINFIMTKYKDNLSMKSTKDPNKVFSSGTRYS